MFSALLARSARLDRDAFAGRLRARGIDSRPFFVPIPELPPYRSRGAYPVAADLAARGLNLPSAPRLERRDVRFVCDEIADLLA
jgi:perosamine synthetase